MTPEQIRQALLLQKINEEAGLSQERLTASEVLLNNSQAEADRRVLSDPNAGIPDPIRFKDLGRGDKVREVLKVLATALSVGASKDPGRALGDTIQQQLEQQRLLEATRERRREHATRRVDNRIDRVADITAANNRAALERAALVSDREDRQAFDAGQNELNRVAAEALQDARLSAQRDLQKGDHALQRELSAADAEERDRRIRIETSRYLLDKYGPSIVSRGVSADGSIDPKARVNRLVDCAQDLDTCSTTDLAALERAELERAGVGAPEALQSAAVKLVGKLQPVYQRDPDTGDLVRDSSNRPVPRRNPMTGEIMKVPITYEEALTQLSQGFEDEEFSRSRVVDEAVLQRMQELDAQLQKLDPGRLESKHLVDAPDGRPGLISVLRERYSANDSASLTAAFDEFEAEQISRGHKPFSDKTRASFTEAISVRESRALSKDVEEAYGIPNPSPTEVKLIQNQERIGKSPREIRRLIESLRRE